MSHTDEEQQVKDSLAEIDSIVKNLVQERNYSSALEIATRGLDIRKSFFGVGSLEFEQARVDVAQMVLECAGSHLIHKQYREATELQAHVDKLTVHPLPRFPALDRGRLLIRVAMLRDMLVCRHHQGRHRSALTFGRHLLDLVKGMHLLYHIPAVYLSIASVYSAMKLHSDALAHCYVAYQHCSRILNALEDPESSPYVLKCLEAEEPDKRLDFKEGYEIFEQCVELSEGEITFEQVSELDISLPRFNVEVDEEEERKLTGFQYLLWAVSSTKRRDDQFPCVKLVAEMEKKQLAPSTEKERLNDAHKRWGGMLALVFRCIAVEQEHLNQISSALLTYKVGYTTALQCLGEAHAVTHQCKSALLDAENSANNKNLQKSYLKRKLDSSLDYSRSRAMTPQPGKFSPNRTNTSSMSRRSQHGPPRPNSQMASTMPIRAGRKERPIWNEWFNSSGSPPSHQQQNRSASSMKPPMTAPNASSKNQFNATLNSTLGTLPSEILNPEAAFLPSEEQPGYQQQRAATVSGLGENRASRKGPNSSTHKKPRTSHGNGRFEQNPPPRPSHRYVMNQRGENDDNMEEIDAADYAYLQQTFGLRHDPNFARSKPRSQQRQHRNKDDVERQQLEAEKKLAQALAVEVGVGTTFDD